MIRVSLRLHRNNKIDFFAAQCLFCKNSRQVDKQCHFRAKNVCGYLAKSCCGLQKHKHAIRYWVIEYVRLKLNWQCLFSAITIVYMMFEKISIIWSNTYDRQLFFIICMHLDNYNPNIIMLRGHLQASLLCDGVNFHLQSWRFIWSRCVLYCFV